MKSFPVSLPTDAVQITGIVVAVAVGTLILVALVLVIRVKSLHN